MLVLATLVALLSPAIDTLPTLRKCGPPAIPIGFMRSAGTVAFQLSAKGTPDTSTLVIIGVEQGSVGGLQSALVRELPSCRFSLGKQSHDGGAIRVRAHVALNGDAMTLTDLGLAGEADTVGLPPEAARPATGEPVAFTDDRLEERPMAYRCDVLVPRDEVTTRQVVTGEVVSNRPVMSIQELASLPGVVPMTGTPQLAAGEVLLRYVVSGAGLVDSASVEIVSAPSPAHAEAATFRVMHCAWVPGRIGGVPVAVRIAQRGRV